MTTALGLTRFARALLYEVTPGDPMTFAMVCTVLAVVASVAALVPARRAANVDPATVLRGD
jgi:ABC-type lipoprotein release transport system permease subunit